MNIKMTEYVNEGKGFKEVGFAVITDAASKLALAELYRKGFKRVKGSGMIGIEVELNDLEVNTKVTFEKVLEW